MPSKEFIVPKDPNWTDRFQNRDADGNPTFPWLRNDGENTWFNIDVYKTYLSAAG